MNRFIQIFLLLVFSSCGHLDKNSNNDEIAETYTAKQNFGAIDNKISRISLDSIINTSPYWRLDNFKTTDPREIQSVVFLKKELRLKGLNTSEFLIADIKKPNDSLTIFQLEHIDYLVYLYNREKMDKDIPPITGNISGHGGWYIVNLNDKKLRITFSQ